MLNARRKYISLILSMVMIAKFSVPGGLVANTDKENRLMSDLGHQAIRVSMCRRSGAAAACYTAAPASYASRMAGVDFTSPGCHTPRP